MAIVFILVGYGLGYILGKSVNTDSIGIKILVSILLPSVLYFLAFWAAGVYYDWFMYAVGASTATFLMGCVSLMVSMLIHIRVKDIIENDDSDDKKILK